METQIGTTIRSYAVVRTVLTNELTDPIGLTIFLSKPDSAEIEETYPGNVVRVSIGLFAYTYTLDQSGQWNRQWHAEGDGVAVTGGDAVIEVCGSQFIPG